MIVVEPGNPRSPEARARLEASHALQRSLYPPEHIFALSIDDLCTPGIAFFMSRNSGTASGCAALAEKTGYGEIKSMFVNPAARGTGTGAALLQALEALPRSRGLPLIRLETGDDLYTAHRLYARHGFSICGPFGDYVEGPHSVFMERRLS
ncbi:MAG: GNAT family N-acetyltransferase [Paracoccaceae bacterium]